MQPESKIQRRVLFTSDAKLAIRRKPAATMSSDSSGQQSTQPADDGQVTLEGYAMVWNMLSDDRGGYRVRLLPGSAQFTAEVHALFHHDFKAILGATGNDTLRITSDDVGVKVEIDLPDTQCAKDVATLVEDRYVTGMSFSMLYDPMPQTTMKTEGGLEISEVSSFTCDEVTVTAIASFTDTSIALQDEDDDTSADPTADFASDRIVQSIRLEQLRLQFMEI